MNAIDQILTGESRNPGLVFAPPSAHLGDDNEPIRIGMERSFDDLICDMRPIEVAGIDVIDSERDGIPQHRNCGVHIPRRSPYVWASKLHRAVPHSVHSHGGTGKREAAT